MRRNLVAILAIATFVAAGSAFAAEPQVHQANGTLKSIRVAATPREAP